MQRGAFSEIACSVAPEVVLRKDHTGDEVTSAWRILFVSGLAGIVENPHVILPKYTLRTMEGVMTECEYTLADAVSKCTGPAERMALVHDMLAGVSRALHIMHRSHVVHGDIKMDNIMFAATKNWVLIDFDLARPFPTGKRIYCPARRPPEELQFINNRAKHRCESLYSLDSNVPHVVHCAADIWALGCVVKEITKDCVLDPATQHVLDELLCADPVRRRLPPLYQALPNLPRALYQPYTCFWTSDTDTRAGMIKDISELGARQSRCVWSVALFCVAVQLLDRFRHYMLLADFEETKPHIPFVCVHAAVLICTEDVPLVDLYVRDNDYLYLLKTAMGMINMLSISLQNPSLHSMQTAEKLIDAPHLLPMYVRHK